MIIDDEELEIDIKDLLYRVLLRWRSILAWMLIFAVLACGFTAFKSYRDYKAYAGLAEEKEEEDNLYELTIDAAKCEKKLTKIEAEQVRKELNDYWNTRQQYMTYRDTVANSLLMELDPYAVSKKQLGFFVDPHAEAEYPVISKTDFTSDILNGFSNSLDSAFYEKVRETTGVDATYDQLRELISTGISGHSIFFTIYGSSEEFCQAVSAVIREQIDDIAPELKKIYGDFDISCNLDTCSTIYDSDLLNRQNTLTNNLNSKKKDFYNYSNNILTSLSSDQKAYFEALNELKLLETGENADGETGTEAGTETEEKLPFEIDFLSVKYLAIGLLIGALLGCCIPACQYLFSAGLKTSDDIKTLTGTTILGTLDLTCLEKKPLSSIDQLLHKIFHGKDCAFSNEERLSMICSGVRIAVEKNQLKKVFITGTGNDKESIDIIAQLSKKLSGSVESIETGRSIVYDPEALESFATADGVVLVERVGASRLDDIKREFETAAQNDVHVIGSVVLN